MYNSDLETFTGAQKWFNLAMSYQIKAENISKNFSNPSEYPDSLFCCYRGYARCVQMYKACFAHLDATNDAYFRRQDYEKAKKEREKLAADFQAKQDKKFILVIGYLVLILIVILFADIWIPFVEWLAHLF